LAEQEERLRKDRERLANGSPSSALADNAATEVNKPSPTKKPKSPTQTEQPTPGASSASNAGKPKGTKPDPQADKPKAIK
jgi:hypothetical protein